MSQLDHDSELYRRYVKKFGTQEDEVEKARVQVAELKKQQEQSRVDLCGIWKS